MQPNIPININQLGAEKHWAVGSSRKVGQGSVLFQVIQPFLVLLRLFGRFPYNSNNSVVRLKIFSGWTLYSTLLAISLVSGLYLTSSQNYHRTRDSFDNSMFAIVGNIIGVVLGSTPVAVWLEAPRLCSYLAKWYSYQEELKSCDIVLDTGLQKWSLLWILLLIPFMLTVSFLQTVHTVGLVAFIVYFILHASSYLIISLWFFLLFFIQHTAALLLANFPESVGHRNVAAFKKLWLSLANLTEDVGSVLGFSLMQSFVINSIVILATSYSLLFVFHDTVISNTNSSERNHFIIAQIGFLIICSILITMICEFGHRCTEAVASNLLKEILKMNIALHDENTQQELHDLVQTIWTRYPNVVLWSFTTINRKLLVSMLSTAITYLVVLVQFRSTESPDGNFLHV